MPPGAGVQLARQVLLCVTRAPPFMLRVEMVASSVSEMKPASAGMVTYSIFRSEDNIIM